jgi:hypothetical protein
VCVVYAKFGFFIASNSVKGISFYVASNIENKMGDYIACDIGSDGLIYIDSNIFNYSDVHAAIIVSNGRGISMA